MSLFGGIKARAGRLFGYDAVEQTGRRKAPAARRRSEDKELDAHKRIVLSSSVRDLQRNFSIAAWAIRKHLDYVSTFSFQADTGDDGLDEQLEELINWWQRPYNCDAGGRLSLSRMVRMGEARRTIDGDVFLNQLADGRLQGLEGDRIIDPKELQAALASQGFTNVQPERVIQGVLTNENGRAIAYAVHKRTGGSGDGLEFERWLSAAFCAHHGYFDRYDQVRGISPLSTAANPLRDVYENFDYALAKAKVSQLFALAITRKAAEDLGTVTEISGQADDPATAENEEKPRYDINFGKGPMMLDLDPDDDAKILESATPSDQFQSFTNSMIGVGLKALDIPFSFYDEAHTNYSGQRQAWIQYDQSAEIKREDNRTLLGRLTAWRIGLFVRDGDLELPRGMSLSKVLRGCSWINRGIPWIDPLKEITADIAAIKACQIGPESAARQRGNDVYKMIDERARVEAYAREKNVVLEYDVAALAAVAAANAKDDAAAGEGEGEGEGERAGGKKTAPKKKTPRRD